MELPLRKNPKTLPRIVHRYLSGVDAPLFGLLGLIFIISTINLAGVVGLDNSLLPRHILLIALGIVIVVSASFFNYRYFKNHSLPSLALYIGAVGLLVVTFFSTPIRNTHAWITVGSVVFEPAELVDLALIILLAKYFSQRHILINQFRHIIISGVYGAIPTLLMLAQPDLGSAVVTVLIWFGMLMTAGINRRQIFIILAIGILVAYMSWIFVLKPYQKDRILSFINPYNDPHGIGYNTIQAQIAIGAGGWLGQGWGKGSQTTLGFLPEPHNDFVFASLAEQFGFLGVSLVLAIIAWMVVRLLQIGQYASNNFGRLFCLGMAIWIATHVTISSAVNLGLLPITGLPFTFLSYGGSHLVSVLAGLGLAQGIKRSG